MWTYGLPRFRDWRKVLREQVEEATRDKPVTAELHVYPPEGAGLFAPSMPDRGTLLGAAKQLMADVGYEFQGEHKNVIGWLLRFRRTDEPASV